MKWLTAYASLNEQQKTFVGQVLTGRNKRHWVQGFAGSGKTLVIVHALIQAAKMRSFRKIGYLTYTHALKDMVESGLPKNVKTKVAIRTVSDAQFNPADYDLLFIDEIQDVKPQTIKALCKGDRRVVVAGDPSQRLYPFSATDSEIRQALGPHQVHVLRDVPRLTDANLRIAANFSDRTLPEAGAKASGAGSKAMLRGFLNKEDEYKWVYQAALECARNGKPCAILFPKREQIHEYAQAIATGLGFGPLPGDAGQADGGFEPMNAVLKANGCALRFFGSSNGNLRESLRQKVIYLMTYHGSKGLDFDHVFLPNLGENTKLDAKPGQLSRPLDERTFFYTALSRAKKQLHLSHTGRRHILVARLPFDHVTQFYI